jgi:hypothetical protein
MALAAGLLAGAIAVLTAYDAVQRKYAADLRLSPR